MKRYQKRRREEKRHDGQHQKPTRRTSDHADKRPRKGSKGQTGEHQAINIRDTKKRGFKQKGVQRETGLKGVGP